MTLLTFKFLKKKTIRIRFTAIEPSILIALHCTMQISFKRR